MCIVINVLSITENELSVGSTHADTVLFYNNDFRKLTILEKNIKTSWYIRNGWMVCAVAWRSWTFRLGLCSGFGDINASITIGVCRPHGPAFGTNKRYPVSTTVFHSDNAYGFQIVQIARWFPLIPYIELNMMLSSSVWNPSILANMLLKLKAVYLSEKLLSDGKLPCLCVGFSYRFVWYIQRNQYNFPNCC